MDLRDAKRVLKKIWYFIWEDDSVLSWIVNVILAFVLIKFIVYPGLGFVVGSAYPIVAVVSGSMEHNGLGFDEWWEQNEYLYLKYNISKEDFGSYDFKNGFNKGDIMVLRGIEPSDIDPGDVIVFDGFQAAPIIHRTVKTWYGNTRYHFMTKGDNNKGVDHQRIREDNIDESRAWPAPFGETIYFERNA